MAIIKVIYCKFCAFVRKIGVQDHEMLAEFIMYIIGFVCFIVIGIGLLLS